MISLEDWAEIRRLHRAEGMPIRAIARKLGISRNTVRRALASDAPPRYQRRPRGSIVDAVEPQIRALLAQWPDMPATVIAERIGWTRGLTVLKDRVRELRPVYRPVDPVSRTRYEPGELAQCDLWFPPVDVPLGFGQHGRPPVLVMVLGYSRFLLARMIPTRQAADLIAGHWRLLSELGASPRTLVWDNEAAVGGWRAGRPVLTGEFAAFRGLLGVKIVLCRPADPEAKGLVERANEYLETSFLPGRVFTGPTDFNVQLADWLARANRRVHRILEARPADRLEADRARMLPLPPVAPAGWWRTSVRLPRDHYVRIDTCDYSVHPVAIGRRVEVVADLDQVQATCDGVEVARHARCWARHQTITDPAHAEAAQAQREAHRLAKTARVPALVEVEQRPLSTYDRIFGVIDGGRADTGEGVA
ncbi:transposase [Carbonactinospora thermoautotrophica]|uniref:Transposase n=1 Tax=Carbonactinospora thermoautotrophica TaxID=1469144 RepID=A0A132MIF0_9ACTN|nr:IS21 family transposase [Carbonactinospora thermoautotrophica]KWW97535.1 transposase [Carbonactinospora thermoautotrophica]KWX10362.1 transposase [Carbonactinospora thermoautotrophica]